MTYRPPFDITPLILKLSQDVLKELGSLSGAKQDVPPIQLRKKNSIRTIQASLAIEGNTLNLDQITHIFEGKRVLGPQKDILEVQNALQLYEDLSWVSPFSIEHFLKAHAILMQDLTDFNGRWREKSVGIFKGDIATHVPPQAKRVPQLMADIFDFITNDHEITYLLKACIFHYELEFIHPFTDGNGRMGRLWQQSLLAKEDPIFQYIPVEEIIKENQSSYYAALRASDKAGHSTRFIEFSLEQILKALQQNRTNGPTDTASRLNYTREKITSTWFSRKNYHNLHSNISSATASRDLQQGLQQEILEKKGALNQTLYKFL